MKPKPRVTNITIARLFNTGNYEHVRFEVSAEVPKGVSAKNTLLELRAIVTRMKPVKKPYEYYRAIAAMNKLPEQLQEHEKLQLEDYKRIVSEYAAWKELQLDALKKLDDLGGSSKKGGGPKDDEDLPW